MIDDIDHQILQILQEKARIPNAEVARQVGMAPSAVLERIRKLEDRGYIEGYEVRLNPHEFGQGLTAFVKVKVKALINGRLATQLSEVAGVQEVHQVAGEDGYLLKFRVADNAELGNILRNDLMMLEGVKATKTSIVLNTIKETRKIDLNH
jgi:Lrp/AsnC family leucine-responsive transcriptional regulator